jgi:hypothetical protein
MTIKTRALEETLAEVIDQLDRIYCDDPDQQFDLEKCRERLWELLQDIKLGSSGEEARHGATCD